MSDSLVDYVNPRSHLGQYGADHHFPNGITTFNACVLSGLEELEIFDNKLSLGIVTQENGAPVPVTPP